MRRELRGCPAPALLALSVLLALFASVAAAASPGASLYAVYCENCHGDDGKGKGPTAEFLSVQPADLTVLALKNGGVFPEERVYHAIDGRDRLRGHGRSSMPIWGLGFQTTGSDADQEQEVARRIRQLVEHLRSLQVEPATSSR